MWTNLHLEATRFTPETTETGKGCFICSFTSQPKCSMYLVCGKLWIDGPLYYDTVGC